MEEHIKYPRTPHLPWSEGATADDIVLSNGEMFNGMAVIVTEKMDGENTTIYSDKIHARSLSSSDHPSRHLVKSLWAKIRHEIPDGMRIIGENLFAKHSILYENLPSVFLVFAIYDGMNCLSWEETLGWCDLFGLFHVPVLYEGRWDKTQIVKCYSGQSRCGGLQEGYVVRNSNSFNFSEFSKNIAKFVRKEHVKTSEHWMTQQIIQNKIYNTM